MITKKEATEPTADYENLDRIAKEIGESSCQKLIIIHGAGSYGHPFAKKYGIGDTSENREDLQRKKRGFCIIQDSVKTLNRIVCEHLRKYGILAVSLQPSSFIITRNTRIYYGNLNLIKKYLYLRFVPVLYGDVVLDLEESIKMAVLSGDQITRYLGEHLKPEKVILGSDVNGIYTKNPKKYPDAQLIDHVSSLDDLEFIEGATTADVTGGMGGKLLELIKLADLGIESEILNAAKPDLIKRALQGERIGTVIKVKEKKIKG